MLKLARPSFLVALALAVGCAEVITYSNRAVEQGDKLKAEGQTEAAAGAYRSATQQNPRNYTAFFRLGECYQELGREQQALQSFRTALDVMPAVDPRSKAPDEVARVATRDKLVDGLANCVAKSSSRDAELAALVAKADASNKPLDHYVVARTSDELGDADAAIDAYDRAVAATGDSPDRAILKRYGLYLARIGQNAKAEATLRKAYALTPEDAEINAALRNLGVVPGPSLLAPGQLHKPVMPKGPLPELEVNIRDQKKAAPAK